jgi:signal transduction histidine kinase
MGYISTLITRGYARNFLKIFIAASLIAVLFQKNDQMVFLMLLRQAIPYIIIYLIVTISGGILKSKYERNQQRLAKMVFILHKKNAKIQEQHLGLTMNYEQMEKLNANLEQIVKQKTFRIEQKNKQLSEIAYTNAHQVRGPLARILGLLQLIAMDPHSTGQYLVRIDNEANNMDDIIQKVGRSIELNMLE